jgi:hypothetical protein
MISLRMGVGEPRIESGDCADSVTALQNLAEVSGAPANALASWTAVKSVAIHRFGCCFSFRGISVIGDRVLPAGAQRARPWSIGSGSRMANT